MTNSWNHATDWEKLVAQDGLSECARFRVPLAPSTSLKIGGTAEVFLSPRSEEELSRSVFFCRKHDVPLRILGGGSNLLIVREIIPVVVSLSRFEEIRLHDDTVYAGAGVLLRRLVRFAVCEGLEGLETLVGIPGTVGGALAGNAGGRWDGKEVNLGNLVQEVRVLGQNGEICALPRSAVRFGYRESSLTDQIILGGTFRLKPSSSLELRKRSALVLRKKAESQPLKDRSAGCTFKNPPQAAAWKLIQEAGLAGKQIGSAMVSKKHSNFIVNLGGACGQDILRLIDCVREGVDRLFGVDLKLEVKLWV